MEKKIKALQNFNSQNVVASLEKKGVMCGFRYPAISI